MQELSKTFQFTSVPTTVPEFKPEPYSPAWIQVGLLGSVAIGSAIIIARTIRKRNDRIE